MHGKVSIPRQLFLFTEENQRRFFIRVELSDILISLLADNDYGIEYQQNQAK